MPTTISGSTGVSQIQDGVVTNADIDTVAASKLTGTIADARFPATLPAASGANLTALPAGNLTGTLPAISGANLTGISDTNGLVLTGSSVENSSGGTTYSAITIDQCFNSTYQHYLIVASFAVESSNVNVNFRYRTGSSGSESTYTDAKYKQVGLEIRMNNSGTHSTDNKAQNTGTSFEIAEEVTPDISNGNYFTMNIFNPQQSGAWTTATFFGTNYTYTNSPWHSPQSLTLVGSAAGRPTGFTIYAASGNIDEHGIRVYGYANS